jgi:hypothetical protein
MVSTEQGESILSRRVHELSLGSSCRDASTTLQTSTFSSGPSVEIRFEDGAISAIAGASGELA